MVWFVFGVDGGLIHSLLLLFLSLLSIFHSLLGNTNVIFGKGSKILFDHWLLSVLLGNVGLYMELVIYFLSSLIFKYVNCALSYIQIGRQSCFFTGFCKANAIASVIHKVCLVFRHLQKTCWCLVFSLVLLNHIFKHLKWLTD